MALALCVLAVVAAACSSSGTADAPATSAASTTTAAPTSTSAAITTTAVEPTGPPPDYAEQGPFWVGAHQSTIPDDGEGRPVPITMWYPAKAQQDGGVTTTTAAPAADGSAAVQGAVVDAPWELSGGPFPLLILSPGLGGPAGAYTPLAVHLASYGFVVVGADHGDHFQDAAGATTALLYDRPDDVMREIAYADLLAAPDGAFAGLIGTTRYSRREVWR